MAGLLLHRADALPRDLAGRTVVVTAGGTREPLDPVRFLGNNSSGRQGFALAAVAAARGARVRLVAANVDLLVPAGVEMERVGSAEQLQAATTKAAADADVVAMVAAVADFRPAERAEHKIKKGAGEPDSIPLTRNPDILAGLVADRAARAHCWSGSPPRPATLQATRWPTAGASWPTRAAISWWSTGWGTSTPSAAPTTPP
jgi:phosphopantothenoylcysteine decarboxylase/phosphopantothenate--cysteine ligase